MALLTHKALLLFAFTILFFSSASGQETCNSVLSDAQYLYDAGQLTEAKDRLQTCTDALGTKAERFEAYRLLALIHLAQGERTEMDLAIRHMLFARPDHIQQTLGNDPKELSNEILGFRVAPRWEGQVHMGASLNSVLVKVDNTVFPNAETSYTPKVGFVFGIGAIRHLNQSSALGFRLQLNSLGIEQQVQINENEEQTASESLALYGIDVNYIHGWDFPGFRLNAHVGLGLSSMYSNLFRIQLKQIGSGEISQQTYEGLEGYQVTQPSLQAALGIEVPLVAGSLEVMVRNAFYWRTVRSSDHLYDDFGLIIEQNYIPDLVRMNSSILEVAYHIPLSYSIKRVAIQ